MGPPHRCGVHRSAGRARPRTARLSFLRRNRRPSTTSRRASAGDDRGERLRALVLTLGESAMPALLAAIDRHNVRQACSGIRIAGKMQNPDVRPALLRSLRISDASRRIESIRTLSLLPDRESGTATTEALDGGVDEIIAVASEELANTEGQGAVPLSWIFWNPASQRRRRALAAHSSSFSGPLGDERAVPRPLRDPRTPPRLTTRTLTCGA